MLRRCTRTLALLAIVAASAAQAESPPADLGIKPSEPSSFDPINLRLAVDSCVFDPATVTVEKTAEAIEVRHSPRNCLVPGETRIVDIRLGTYPAGQYLVYLYTQPRGDVTVTPINTFRFIVTPRPEIAVVPPPARPLTDYTGMWWTPTQGGWGLSLHQGAGHSVFATLYVYDTNGQPQWFTILPGGWSSATRWTGVVYRSTALAATGPVVNPQLVTIQSVGMASIEFGQAVGQVGKATLEYTINGVTTTRTIERYPVQ